MFSFQRLHITKMCSAFDYGISEYHEDCENWQAEWIFGDSSCRSSSWLDD